MAFSSEIMLFFGGAEAVQDLMITKNSLLDKTEVQEMVFSNYFGNSFLFSKGDDLWKSKRKATAHAFYKDRLSLMIDALKGQLQKTMSQWLAKIKDGDGQLEIDLDDDILPIFQ